MIGKKISVVLSIVAVIALMVPLVYYGFPKMFADSIYPAPPQSVVDAVNECAPKFNIDIPLVYATIAKESNFNERAVSPVGAGGLMQLMPATWNGMVQRYLNGAITELSGVSLTKDRFDVKSNVCLGIAYLAGALGTYNGNVTAALIAYNGGDAAAKRYLAAGSAASLVAETRSYAPKILAAREYYASIFGFGDMGEGGSEGVNAITTTKTPNSITSAVGSSDATGAFWKAFINDYFKPFIGK